MLAAVSDPYVVDCTRFREDRFAAFCYAKSAINWQNRTLSETLADPSENVSLRGRPSSQKSIGLSTPDDYDAKTET